MQRRALLVTSKYILKNDLEEAASSLLVQKDYRVQTIEAERIMGDMNLLEYSIVIYCVGSHYCEPSLAAYARYVKNGGNLVVLSGNPFSKPYQIEEGQIKLFKECAKGIRAFGFGDTFLEVDLPTKPVELKLLRKEFGEAEEQLTDVCSVWSGLYHLSEQDENGEMRKKAKLIPIAAMLDEEKHRLASPVIEIRTEGGGRFYCFSWENVAGNILESELVRRIFRDICERCVVEKVLLEAEMEYAFYRPGELPVLCLRGKSKEKNNEGNKSEEKTSYCDVTVRRLLENEVEEVYKETSFDINGEKNLPLPVKAEGQYEVIIDAFSEGIWMDSVSTGFYLMSEESVHGQVEDFLRVEVNPDISSDFCVRNGKPYPILGTTYFVTDVYQECFLHFNLARCEKDLKRLKEDGFNTLRSGNWMLNVEFMGEDGSICEKARRSLYAYFLCACKYDFVVQFTLGCVTLNDWDRDKCAIHNPENTRKVLNLVDSFTKLYRVFPNVMLDVVNEPSYSYRGGWILGIPSNDPYERNAWQAWLTRKYKTVEDLRQAWGENSVKMPNFESISVPEDKSYTGTLYRTEEEREYTKVVDFYQFARESYSAWLKQIRQLARENAPDMAVIMGRDESLRVPCEQDEVLQGNLDMVCWHQWNQNSLIFTEYMLNRVKGKITCAQELGVYRVEKMRGGKMLTDVQIANQLIRKLLFGFGNWIQWQSFDNPDKAELSENMLGLYRADGSETAVMCRLRPFIEAEKRGMRWMENRQEDAFPILTVYGTSSHFSLYHNIAQEALRNHIQLLFRKLRNQSDMMLEHLFDRAYQTAIGSPALLILPGIMRISQYCWEELLHQVEQGTILLISGCVEEDEHFCSQKRIGLLEKNGIEYSCVKDYEFIEIDGEEYLLDFRKDCGYPEVQNALKMAVAVGEKVGLKEYNLGTGKVIYCPLPLELAEDKSAACALYRYAIQAAQAENKIYRVTQPERNENFEIHAIVYQSCTVYTIINDGPEAELEIMDLRSRTRMQISFAELGMGKIWLGADGTVLNKYTSEGSEFLI